jgi:hypothetical protein
MKKQLIITFTDTLQIAILQDSLSKTKEELLKVNADFTTKAINEIISQVYDGDNWKDLKE